ncbi:MAG: efflux RND transporter periplasmic adaptor subunit [Bacteroidales bacterium]|jgi:membrane fusion protein (multidrug efflux system)
MKKATFLIIITGIIFSLSSCNNAGKKGDEAQTNETEARKVNVSKVVFQPVEQNVTFTANIESNTKNNIASAIPSRIRKINVEIGDRVSKGQVLVELDKNNLLKQEAQINNFKADLQRYTELLKVGGISQQQVDQLQLQIKIAEATLENLEENTILKSPINGVVTARNYDEGDMPAQFPILTVESLNPVKAVINVSEKYFAQVKKGQPVKVKIDTYSDEVFNGNISLIYPIINQATHTFSTEISIPNNSNKIKPGMFCRVEINLGTNDRALIDDMAVIKQSGSNDRYVFIVKDGKAVYTKVELGIRIDDKYEIVSGLNPDDIIITRGNTGLVDGAPVEIID